MANVFISYHMKSAGELARKIADELESVGISCWYANRDMIPGQFVKSIMDAINQCKIFLLILNEEANQSKYVFNELSNAYRRFEDGIIILPFKVGEFQISDNVQFFLTTLHIINGGDSMKNVRTEELIPKVVESLGKTPQKQQTPDIPQPSPEVVEPPQKTASPQEPSSSLLESKPLTLLPIEFSISWIILLVAFLALLLFCKSLLFPTQDIQEQDTPSQDAREQDISSQGAQEQDTPLQDAQEQDIPNLPTWTLDGTKLIISGNYYTSRAPWYQLNETATEVTIESGVTHIGNYAFENFTKLKKVTMADSVTEIGDSAFSNCVHLQEVVFSDSLTYISHSAFSYCALSSVEIPDSVTEIRAYAFYGCGNLSYVYIPNGVKNIGSAAFSGCKLDSVVISPKTIIVKEFGLFDSPSFDLNVSIEYRSGTYTN